MNRSIANWFWLGGFSLFFVPFALIYNFAITSRPEYLILFSFPHFILSYVIYYKHLRSVRVLTPEIVRFGILLTILAVTFVFWKNLQLPVILAAQGIFLYHLAMQSFGVAVIYAGVNFRDKKLARLVLKTTFLAWAAAAWFDSQTSLSTLTLFKTTVSSLQLAPEFATLLTRISLVLTITSIGYYLLKVREARKLEFKKDIFPLTAILSFAAWCTPQTKIATSGLIAVFHGLQYLPFAFASLQSKIESRVALGFTLLMSLVLGALVFDQVPRYLSQRDPLTSTFAISCIYLTLNLFHFFLEAKVWKGFKPVKSLDGTGLTKAS